MSKVQTVQQKSGNTKKWLIASVIIAIGIINQLFWVWNSRQKELYNNTDAGLAELRIEQTKADTKLLKQAGGAPHQNSTLGVIGNKSVTNTKSVPMFDCRTIEKRDYGFQTEAIQDLDRSDAVYVFSPGCARIVMTEKMADSVTSLQSPGQYIFRQKDNGDQDRYTGCGNIDGRNDSPSSCLSYLKIRVGQVFEVINVDHDIIFK